MMQVSIIKKLSSLARPSHPMIKRTKGAAIPVSIATHAEWLWFKKKED
jgi:hypothetical protein